MDTNRRLAEILAPELATPVHPGDDENPPTPLVLGGIFGPYELPEGMTNEDLEEAGIPTPDTARLFLEFVFHIIETKAGCSIVDTRELADLRAAAASREHKRNEMKHFTFECGKPAFRVMVKDFDTDNPIVPCAVDDVIAGHKHG